MLYEKKVKYLDYRENGERIRGCGFVKMEVRDGNLRIEVNVTGLHPTDSFARDVILCGGGREAAAGKIEIAGGKGQYRQIWRGLDDIGGSRIRYGELSGIRIPLGAERDIACIWQVQNAAGETEKAADRKAAADTGAAIRRGISVETDAAIKREMAVETDAALKREMAADTGAALKQGASAETEAPQGTKIPGTGATEKVAREGGTAADRRAVTEKGESTLSEKKDIGAGSVETTAAAEKEPKRRTGEETGRNIAGKGGWYTAEKERNTEEGYGEDIRDDKRINAGAKAMLQGSDGAAEAVKRTDGSIGDGTDGRVAERADGSTGNLADNTTAEVQAVEKDREKQERNYGTGKNVQSNVPSRGKRGAGRPVKLLEDKWSQLWAVYPHIRPFQDNREYISIGPEDFVLFPSSSYRMVNNSFLLHGYYNYRHLILVRTEREKEAVYYIGVPGNFYEKEKQVAVMFGFESFECAEEPAQAGDFGYYMMRTEL